jgi:hypothetical protein
MDILFIIGFGFLMPAIAAKSLRAKLILFLNAFLIMQKFLDITEALIKNDQLGNAGAGIDFLTVLLIPSFITVSLVYFGYGVVKIIRRRNDYLAFLKTKKHDFSLMHHFRGPLDKEEVTALILSWPSIIMAIVIFVDTLGSLLT